MDAQRWARVRRLFEEALTLPAEARRTFLDAACVGDDGLAAQVAAMLEEDGVRDALLDRGLAPVADAMLGGSAPPPGTRIGHYTIRRLLGEGGMGVVCLAEREDLGQVVAIKVLRDAWLSPLRRARFHDERRLLARLNHPHIARLYDADTLADGTPWFAMEYVEGLALTRYCEQHACSIVERLRLFRQACEAVRFAHGHAVIHRDIKPSNVLVNAEGGVKLLDFGIAKQLDSIDDPRAGTRTVARLMTPAYAAPEQLAGDEVGVQADVYSLGVVLYELLADRLPFDPEMRAGTGAAAVPFSLPPIKPSKVSPWGPGRDGAPGRSEWNDLDMLCLTALHADRARRYGSVEALMRDIDHFLQAEPLEACPDRWGYRAGKFLRRHWPVVSVATGAAVLALALSVFFTVRLSVARDAALAEAARTERVQAFMTNLFRGGDALAGPRDELRVVDMLAVGVREAETLAADPPLQAELLHNLAVIYARLGRLDEADRLFAQSLALRSSAFGAESAEVAESLVALGLLRVDQARLAEGEGLIREGLDMARRRLPESHPQVLAANLALGQTLRERGSYDAAIAILSDVVAQRSTPDAAPLDRAAALVGLADAYYASGDYAQSGALYREVIERHRAVVGEVHPLVAADLASLAAIEQDLGYYDRAETLAREALAINQQYYGATSPHTADNLTSLGRALVYGEKYDEAQTVLERALAVQEAAFGVSHPLVAEAVNEIGNLLAMRDLYADAEAHFRRAADIYRSVHGERHYLVAIALSNVAYMEMQQGDYAAAEALFRHVVALFVSTLSADNVNTGIARIKLGRTLRLAGRYSEAAQESLAGYEVLIRQASPSVSYLRAARDDLVLDYEAIGEAGKAAHFRAEIAAQTSAVQR